MECFTKFSIALMKGCLKNFGGKFETYKFLVRLSILLRGLVKISYLVFLILKREVFWWIVCELCGVEGGVLESLVLDLYFCYKSVGINLYFSFSA